MHEGVCHPGYNSTVGHGTKAHALQPCPLSSQSYRNLMWVSVLSFFPTKHICDPLESRVLHWGVAISERGLCWLDQTAATWEAARSEFHISQPHMWSFLLSLEGTTFRRSGNETEQKGWFKTPLSKPAISGCPIFSP